MPKKYCGIGKLPKGMEYGTPEYCLTSNQVRYYGEYAIDKKLLEKKSKSKKKSGSKSSRVKYTLEEKIDIYEDRFEKAGIIVFQLRGKIKKLTKLKEQLADKIKKENDKTTKKELTGEYNDVKKEILDVGQKLTAQLDKFEKYQNKLRAARKLLKEQS
jgi:hypothetical protein